MRLLLVDFETTGLDVKKARITEFCVRVLDTVTKEVAEKKGYLWDSSYPPITKEITDITRIDETLLRTQGLDPKTELSAIAATAEYIDYFVSHNAYGLDKPLLEEECKRMGITLPSKPWICSMRDIPYPEKMRCRKLSHLAIDHGIQVDPNLLHGASGDVDLMGKIIQFYDMVEAAKLASSPFVVARAQVSYNDKDLAKNRGYSWEKARGNETVFPKTWVKMLRECQWDEELSQAPFPISKVIVKEV